MMYLIKSNRNLITILVSQFSLTLKIVFLNFNTVVMPGKRLHDVKVGLSNSSHTESVPAPNNYELCASHPGQLGAITDIECTTPTLAQYVVVQIMGTEVLTLCEVVVFGHGMFLKRANLTILATVLYFSKLHLCVQFIQIKCH